MHANKRYYLAVTLGVLAVLASVFIPIGVGWALGLAPNTPSLLLPLLLISGVVALLAGLVLVAVAIAALDMSDKTQALSLPRGSMRAVIALSLMLIFAITTVFFYFDMATDSDGARAAQYAEHVTSIVGTLLAAAAAFYFASKAVEGGVAAVVTAQEQERKMVEVPNVVGLGAENAEELIKGCELVPATEEVESAEENVGKVVEQLPEAGARVDKGSVVLLRIGKGSTTD